MRSAVLAVGLCALVPLVYGGCFQSLLETGVMHCQDKTDKTWHAVGSTWTNSRCVKCSCSTELMMCCDGLESDAAYPEDCIVVYDYGKCTFNVVKKNDKSVSCP